MWKVCLITFVLGLSVAGLIAWQLCLRWLRKQTAKERKLLQRTRGAEKLAELGALASHLAHEIRNPLSTVKVNLQLLSEDIRNLLKMAKNSDAGPADSSAELCQKYNRQLRKIETIMKETDRLADTLNDFLRYAGRMEIHTSRHDINEILDDLIDFYEPQAIAKSVQMRHCLSEKPAYCPVDSDLLKQAILNLFINATQAMTDGGELMIRSTIQSDTVQIDVIDTGPGIAPEEQEKIFNAYYTTKPGGSGLGLPTCQRIIEEHGGQLSLHSEVGKGSIFTITLPLCRE
jgi:signal transduction histidine kinase